MKMTKDSSKTKKQVDDLTDKLTRVLADYQNLEKRIAREKEEFIDFANAKLVVKILPALDSLEKAEAHLKDAGLSLAIKQLTDSLKAEGLEKIEVLGKEFNPEEMECVQVADGGKDNEVAEEIRSGYRLNDKVLRPAQVRVYKNETKQEAQDSEKEDLQKTDFV